MKIDPVQNRVSLLRKEGPREGKYKWLRGIYVARDDSIIAIPANATGVLRIDAKTDQVLNECHQFSTYK